MSVQHELLAGTIEARLTTVEAQESEIRTLQTRMQELEKAFEVYRAAAPGADSLRVGGQNQSGPAGPR
jgi:hypothetical protein